MKTKNIIDPLKVVFTCIVLLFGLYFAYLVYEAQPDTYYSTDITTKN